MEFNENGFYKHNGNVIEGFIDDSIKSLDEVRLVFILKEPNSGGKPADKFWFKEIVEQNKSSNSYYSKLGKIACLLLNKGDDIQNALKQCAYINLYPVKGGKEASEQYQNVFNAFKNKDCNDDCNGDIKKIVDSRWNIINNLPDGCKILTLGEVFGAISKNEQSLIENANGIGYLYIERNGILKKKFDSFSFNNGKGDIEVYSIYHPQARGRNSFKAENIFLNE